MSHLHSADVIEILNALPNRTTIHPRTEANWFMFGFDVDGDEYELAVNVHNGTVSLSQEGEIVYEAGGR